MQSHWSHSTVSLQSNLNKPLQAVKNPKALTAVFVPVSPGADAAEKVFERDAKRLGNQARNKAGQAAGKAKKVTKKARR